MPRSRSTFAHTASRNRLQRVCGVVVRRLDRFLREPPQVFVTDGGEVRAHLGIDQRRFGFDDPLHRPQRSVDAGLPCGQLFSDPFEQRSQNHVIHQPFAPHRLAFGEVHAPPRPLILGDLVMVGLG